MQRACQSGRKRFFFVPDTSVIRKQKMHMINRWYTHNISKRRCANVLQSHVSHEWLRMKITIQNIICGVILGFLFRSRFYTYYRQTDFHVAFLLVETFMMHFHEMIILDSFPLMRFCIITFIPNHSLPTSGADTIDKWYTNHTSFARCRVPGEIHSNWQTWKAELNNSINDIRYSSNGFSVGIVIRSLRRFEQTHTHTLR